MKEMDLAELRRNVSVVMQDTFLFSDTIEANIKFGAGEVSDEVFMAACRDAMVEEFVSQMPEGYRTVIGERGIGLSGGQKQRISIARALVRDAKVLIMDDSTSALDMETEHAIQRAMDRRKGFTCFIIAHRVSAVKMPMRSFISKTAGSWRGARMKSFSGCGADIMKRIVSSTAIMWKHWKKRWYNANQHCKGR